MTEKVREAVQRCIMVVVTFFLAWTMRNATTHEWIVALLFCLVVVALSSLGIFRSRFLRRSDRMFGEGYPLPELHDIDRRTGEQ